MHPQQFVLLADWSGFLGVLLGILMFLAAVFLILLILVQRGRGGGLTGALGGMGGQSAFGAKAGDTFTKITIWAATFWILLCMTGVVVLNRRDVARNPNPGASATGSSVPAGDETSGTDTEKPAGAGAGGGGTSGAGSNTRSSSGTEKPASGGTGN
jgi:preprotein translocase subunit SecG